MTVIGSTMPTSSFRIERHGDEAEIRFYCNIEDISSDGNSFWKYDEYIIERNYRDTLADDIENNYEYWLNAAKLEDEMRTPVDMYQLRADVDYQGVMLQVMSPISLMSVSAGSDPDVLEMARKYYPLRWSESRLRVLVAANKLTASDFESITGTAYDNEDDVV